MPTLCITFYNKRRAYEFGFGRPGFQVKCLGKMDGHEVAVVVAVRSTHTGISTSKYNLWWSCSVSAVWADDKYPYLFPATFPSPYENQHFPGHHIHPYPTSHH